MKKKILALVLALAMALSLMTGCGSVATPAATPTVEPTEEPTPEPTPTPEPGISLESIAELNNCTVDELNALTDEDGYVTFVGNKLSDDTIKNGSEAIAFVLTQLTNLLDLDGIDLALYSTYSSNQTGITYYRFQQVIASDLDVETHNGTEVYEDIASEFLPTGMKLGVDEDGYPVVISSDINHADMDFDASTLITMEDAENAVLAANPDAYIYPDYTDFTMWQDVTSRAADDGYTGEVRLVYLVYADNENEESVNPYLCYVVAATGGAGSVLATLSTNTLGEYAQSKSNTTLSFFDRFEDAGEYTYTVNFNWMSEADRTASQEYFGSDSIEVTVPVMYNPEDGLYYLGEKDHYITMSNYVDAMLNSGNTDMLNLYVTDNPEELTSWHFVSAGNEEMGWVYLDDPNYVIASFAEYVKIIHAFDEKFNWFESFPNDSYLLETYTLPAATMVGMLTNGGSYPTENSGFEYNASNSGQFYDWTSFQTSPNLGLCLDDVTMSHEFTHGVNMHFTNSLYANEQGAMMESLADMVGYHMAASINEKVDNWQVGGSTGPVFRVMNDPVSVNNPEYKGGVFYVNTAPNEILNGGLVDCGGVHTNSAVPNYMGYLLDEGQTGEGEENFTNEESLNMWFETLYLTCYNTDFIDMGAYLKFAAEQLGYTSGQQTYLARVLSELGFIDGVVSEDLLNSEDSKVVNFHLDFENEAAQNEYYFATVSYTESGAYAMSGGFDNNTDQSIRIVNDGRFVRLMLCAQSSEMVVMMQSFRCYIPYEDLQDDNTFHVKVVNLKEGENLIFGEGETAVWDSIDGIYTLGTDDTTGYGCVSFASTAPGMIATHTEGAADGEFTVYLVVFNGDETEETAAEPAEETTGETVEETTEEITEDASAEATEEPAATETPVEESTAQ